MKRLNTVMAAALALAGLIGCGGSSNNGTTSARTTQGALTAVSTTGAKTVTVNGAVIDDSAATIKVDDNPTGHEALQPGMVVIVKVDDKGKATEIQHHAQLRGTIEDSSKTASTVTIGGQVVRVDDSTHFEDNSVHPGSLTSADRVRVSGFPDDRGGLRATRIERDRSAQFEFEVHGFVSNLNAGAKTFTLTTSNAPGAPSFSVTASALPTGIANGSIVEVKSTTQPAAGGAITATLVKLDDDLGDAQQEAEVEGIVTSGDSTSFVIAGVTVKTTSATKWVGGAPADLAVGVKVEAEGPLDASGAIAATKVSFRDSLRVQGAVANVSPQDLQNGTFTMFNGAITVHVSDVTRLELSLAALAGSGVVEVRGYPSSTGGGDMVATRIRAGTGGGGGGGTTTRIFLQGPVSAVDSAAKTVTILNITVNVSGAQLKARDETTLVSGDFFASVTSGTVVKARADSAAALSGTTLTASEVELEDDK